MAEGNGVDIASVYGLLVEIGKAVSRHDVMLERINDKLDRQDARLASLEDRMSALEGRVERGFAAVAAEFADIRQTIAAYHASVVGHGIAISEMEDRVRRIEGHLDLPPFVHG